MVFQTLVCGESYENFYTVQHFERWIDCPLLSVNVFVMVATQ
jgi:hypothetical protein